MPNINYLNGAGHWCALPISLKNILMILMSLSCLALFISFLIAPIPIHANSPAPIEQVSSYKPNTLENADEFRIGPKGYKHWRVGNVWFSDAPKELGTRNLLKTTIDTTYYDEIRMDPFSQPNDSNLVWYRHWRQGCIYTEWKPIMV